MLLLSLSCLMALCQPPISTGTHAVALEERLLSGTPANEAGPLVEPLFNQPAGYWRLRNKSGACRIRIKQEAQARSGEIIWPRCRAMPFRATRWTLEGTQLLLWSPAGKQVAAFRTDMLPPLTGVDAAGNALTLLRDRPPPR